MLVGVSTTFGRILGGKWQSHRAALCMAVTTRNASNQEKWSKVGMLD